MLFYQSGAVTKTGKRDKNQDNYFLNGLYNQEIHDDCSDENVGQGQVALFAVADGMGGEKSGERASFLLAERLSKIDMQASVDMPEIVSRAILDVNETLCAIMKKENVGRMGSTVVSLLYADQSVYIRNLGDSPAYLNRDGKLEKLSKDHTEGQAMLDGGVLSKDQLMRHPSRNRLTRHLGIFPSELELEVAQYPPLSPLDGDVFLLCSDGVSGALSAEQLCEILSRHTSAKETADEVVSEAIRLGSRDNCTALVLRFARKPFPSPRKTYGNETKGIVKLKVQKSVRNLVTHDQQNALPENKHIETSKPNSIPDIGNKVGEQTKRKSLLIFLLILSAELSILVWLLYLVFTKIVIWF